MGLLSSLAGAALNVGGALINKRQADKQHQFNTHQFHTGLAQQEKFAKAGIRWKVADARAAGIHPLAALGASTSYGSPATVGTAPVADMQGMGQDIGRAIAATSTNHERKVMDLQLDNMKMDNEMKRMEVISQRRRLAGQVGPGVPDDVKSIPAQVTSHQKGKLPQEAGSITSVGFARTAGGGLTPVPSKDAKERIEDQFIPEMVWAGQNYVAPMLGDNTNKPSKSLLPKGKGYKDWQWDYSSFTWKPVKHKGKNLLQRVKGYFKKTNKRFPWRGK
jgi:hypothetical protein